MTDKRHVETYGNRTPVDKSYLYDWYIHSVSEDDAPVWTEEHIDELIKDFECYPKRAEVEAYEVNRMKMIIDIPEELYKAYEGRPPMLGDEGFDMIAQSIANGTPLPKGHGDLIDRKRLLDDLHSRDYTEFTHRDFIALVDYADTIIEADKEGEQE